MTEVMIRKSSKPSKNYDVIINDKKVVSFGDSNFDDVTLHKDVDRKQRYINRHKSNEQWSKSGLNTAGYYSRWILWNKPTIQQSINDLNNRYKHIKFILSK